MRYAKRADFFVIFEYWSVEWGSEQQNMAGSLTSKYCHYVGPIASVLDRDYKVCLGSRNGEVDNCYLYWRQYGGKFILVYRSTV
jgi:hypothetical protein